MQGSCQGKIYQVVQQINLVSYHFKKIVLSCIKLKHLFVVPTTLLKVGPNHVEHSLILTQPFIVSMLLGIQTTNHR